MKSLLRLDRLSTPESQRGRGGEESRGERGSQSLSWLDFPPIFPPGLDLGDFPWPAATDEQIICGFSPLNYTFNELNLLIWLSSSQVGELGGVSSWISFLIHGGSVCCSHWLACAPASFVAPPPPAVLTSALMWSLILACQRGVCRRQPLMI